MDSLACVRDSLCFHPRQTGKANLQKVPFNCLPNIGRPFNPTATSPFIMFFRPSFLLASVFIGNAAAAATRRCTTPIVAFSPTSPQCCSSVVSSSSSQAAIIGDLLLVCLSGLLVDVGIGCSPISVIGNNCGATTVMCEAPPQEWGGLLAINCIPITL
ncbi:hypothetical protein DFH09DRAFT_1305979 [Mycena vulgaris]|nr:hypothetical protein DFH09DRAFT_1305979 [Mycena vulgaris]